MEQELYRIFGGYEGYMNAPYGVVQRHKLVVLARWEVDAEQQKKQEDELDKARGG